MNGLNGKDKTMKIHDITATLSQSLPFYSEDDPFFVEKTLQLKNGDMCDLSHIKMTSHTGTHADMPLHFIESGENCEGIQLDYFYGKVKVMRINLETHRNITKEDLTPHGINQGDRILISTGQSIEMDKPLIKDFIALTPEAAEYLAEKKIKTLGFDYISVDIYNSPDFPVHKTLLGNGIVIIEGLVLHNIPPGEYTLSALPLKFEYGDGSPVRAILIEEKERFK